MGILPLLRLSSSRASQQTLKLLLVQYLELLQQPNLRTLFLESDSEKTHLDFPGKLEWEMEIAVKVDFRICREAIW